MFGLEDISNWNSKSGLWIVQADFKVQSMERPPDVEGLAVELIRFETFKSVTVKAICSPLNQGEG